ncbi:MAG: hypothetical protein APR55_10635 [Methanolinea sp. SDB]|nr:MAG: hypothetical protein APR55_10635 [Methanolinea sp. SDB]
MSRLVGYIQELADSLEDWERYRKIPAARFQTDRDTRNMVLHAMLLAIQSAIDIATEVIVLKGYKRPASYRETFGILEANGILTRDLARPLSNLAGFRNVLVHVYWDLDLVQVYAILQRDLPVLQEFLAEMKTFARTRYDRGDA